MSDVLIVRMVHTVYSGVDSSQSVSVRVAQTVSNIGVGGGGANLGYTASSTQGTVTSDSGTDATIPAVSGSDAGLMTPTQKSKLDGIEAGADVTDATNVAAAGAFMKSTDDTDDITVGTTNKFATQSEKDKLSNITITQPVDLDAIETRVNELDAAVILKGSWDASAGTFPGGGVAQAGWSYIVSVAGTVDGVSFSLNDRIIAITDNASTSTYASNWFKADYTDLVTSVDGATGAVTVGAIIAAASTKDAIADTDLFGMSDSESSNATKKTAWSNIKSKLNTYFASIYQAILVSGTNIKTINGNSLLGSGDIVISGSLTNWTEAYSASTQSTSSFTATNAASNVNAALIPKGTGALTASVPDGTTTSGNSRGNYAVDWQRGRSNANQVAEGAYSTIAGGANNRVTNQYGFAVGIDNVVGASGGFYGVGVGYANVIANFLDGGMAFGRQNYIYNNWAVAFGQSNLITGVCAFGAGQANQTNADYASAPGGFRANAALYGQRAHASGYFAAVGDAQAHELIFRAAVTGTSITELFLDGASIRAILPSTNTIWQGTISIAAVTTAVGNGTGTAGDVIGTEYKVTIKRIGTSTVLVGTVQEIGTSNADTSMSTASFTIDANDTNEALRIQFTPPSTAGTTSTYRVVATFIGTQIRY